MKTKGYNGEASNSKHLWQDPLAEAEEDDILEASKSHASAKECHELLMASINYLSDSISSLLHTFATFNTSMD